MQGTREACQGSLAPNMDHTVSINILGYFRPLDLLVCMILRLTRLEAVRAGQSHICTRLLGPNLFSQRGDKQIFGKVEQLRDNQRPN
jgi:hypothetical protein